MDDNEIITQTLYDNNGLEIGTIKGTRKAIEKFVDHDITKKYQFKLNKEITHAAEDLE